VTEASIAGARVRIELRSAIVKSKILRCARNDSASGRGI
jgi:hypothetical protein